MIFFPALADGIIRRALFNVWKEEQDAKRKIDAVLSLVRSTTDFDKCENQQQLKFRKIVKNFCLFVEKKGMKCDRNEKFLMSNDAWLSGEGERREECPGWRELEKSAKERNLDGGEPRLEWKERKDVEHSIVVDCFQQEKKMVMSETHSEKRKFGKAAESSANKKARREVSKKYGKFTEDCIPDGVFPIGDDVFVYASTYYDSVSVHIRRFKKYGTTYYPTPEGITLDPRLDRIYQGWRTFLGQRAIFSKKNV
ncbi:hypothetical protein TNCV_3620021 [Trichonephila clavipes]|nr:hypothetical protein TNCV_3620021 [Trichonephila clavipes]